MTADHLQGIEELEASLWKLADNLRANSNLASIVHTIVNVIEPDHGIILDPACGSGGMFAQSSHFIEVAGQNPMNCVTFYGHKKNELFYCSTEGEVTVTATHASGCVTDFVRVPQK